MIITYLLVIGTVGLVVVGRLLLNAMTLLT